MDALNDSIQKKNLGAFYTPDLYAEKSVELVRQAINRVPPTINTLFLTAVPVQATWKDI